MIKTAATDSFIFSGGAGGGSIPGADLEKTYWGGGFMSSDRVKIQNLKCS